MVKIWLCLILCLMSIHPLTASVIVEATVDNNIARENYPATGTITITHSQSEVVDTGSFQLDHKPFTTTFVKDSILSKDTVVSIYMFTLPGQAAGLYILPTVSVKVGQQVYSTVPSSYEVLGLAATNRAAPSRPSAPQSPPQLKLEATVKGPSTLYPGQKTTLFYRISYNVSVDLTDSNLPFVHPKDFQKIGDAHVNDYQEAVFTIQEISQEIEALQPGTFSFGPSSIAGYAYQTNAAGQKVYDPTPLQAQAPVINLVVHPFPLEEQPPSFNGALGTIKADLKMTTPSTLNLGEQIVLTLSLSGISNLEPLHLSPLACQPGFSGFFQLNDLPPAAKIVDSVKQFQIELKPISRFVHAIPSIEISSFDPASGKYQIQRTTPIPLTIHTTQPTTQKPLEFPVSLPDWNKIWTAPFQPAPPLVLKSHPLPANIAYQPWTGSPWVFLIIPAGILLLFLNRSWHKKWINRPRPILLRSQELFHRAMHDHHLSSIQVIRLLEQAFWWKLKEQGIAKADHVSSFITYLQSLQYGRDKDFVVAEVQAEARSRWEDVE